MAHRRVKDIDYDEEEYEEYYSGEDEYGYEGAAAEDTVVAANHDDDELSAEDKEQLRIGTESVREALGDGFPSVTDAAIQEALWHYYYDVAKSATYLKNQASPKQAQPKKPKQKQVSKFDEAAVSAAQKPVDIKVPTGPLLRSTANPADLFKDIPWFNVPDEMLGSIMPELVRPPLRLLGGSGKPSKLAALAAARKKKEAEQKAAQDASHSTKPTGVASLMDRLGTRSTLPSNQENTKPGDMSQQPETRPFPIRKRKSPSPPPPPQDRRPSPPELASAAIPEPPTKPAEHVRAGPSIFASTMCGGSSRSRPSQSDAAVLSENILPAIYGHDAHRANPNAFSGPSPDDIVMQAQAKGSARS